MKPWRHPTHKEKGKMKMSEYGTKVCALDQSESETSWSKDGPREKGSDSAKRSIKNARQKLCQSTRQKNPVVWYGYKDYMGHHYLYMVKVAEVHEPEIYAEASKDAIWCTMMEEEMRALADNKTWDLVDAPKGVKPIRCRWVYKVKYNADGSINIYKTRLVAKGYAHATTVSDGVCYDEVRFVTFHPVV